MWHVRLMLYQSCISCIDTVSDRRRLLCKNKEKKDAVMEKSSGGGWWCWSVGVGGAGVVVPPCTGLTGHRPPRWSTRQTPYSSSLRISPIKK